MVETIATPNEPEIQASNAVSRGLTKAGTGVQRVAGWLDQADELADVAGPVGIIASAIAGVGEAGIYAAGGLAKIGGDIADGRLMDAGRHVVSTGVGVIVTAVPFIEHSSTVEQALKVVKGDVNGAITTKSLAEKLDDFAFEKTGGEGVTNPEDSKPQIETVDEVKQDEGLLSKAGKAVKSVADVAGYVPVIGTPVEAAGRAAGGALIAADDVANGEFAQAGRTAAAHAASAGVTLVPGVSLVNAGIGGAELVANSGDISKTVGEHKGVQEHLEESIEGRSPKKAHGAHSARVLAEGGRNNEQGSFASRVSGGNKSSASKFSANKSQVAMLKERDAAMTSGGGRGIGSSGREITRNKPKEESANA